MAVCVCVCVDDISNANCAIVAKSEERTNSFFDQDVHVCERESFSHHSAENDASKIDGKR